MHNFDLFYALFHALFYVKTPTVTPHRYTVGVTAPPGHPRYTTIEMRFKKPHRVTTIKRSRVRYMISKKKHEKSHLILFMKLSRLVKFFCRNVQTSIIDLKT